MVMAVVKEARPDPTRLSLGALGWVELGIRRGVDARSGAREKVRLQLRRGGTGRTTSSLMRMFF